MTAVTLVALPRNSRKAVPEGAHGVAGAGRRGGSPAAAVRRARRNWPALYGADAHQLNGTGTGRDCECAAGAPRQKTAGAPEHGRPEVRMAERAVRPHGRLPGNA